MILGLGLTIAPALSSCFTGIESTPKITAGDVARDRAETVTDEQVYLADIGGERPAEWKPGKRFFVTDNKIDLIFGATASSAESLQGQYIVFETVNDVSSITGQPVAEITFRSPSGNRLKYRLDMSVADLFDRAEVAIPFTIEESLVDAVVERMEGQTYYVVTSHWYDESDNTFKGFKYVPVTVKKVLPGNSVYPIKLIMAMADGKLFNLFMSTGTDMKTPRTFASLFSLTDPRTRYPNITDKMWDCIVKGQVAADMTRDECRLALGAPKSVDRRAGYSFLREIWIYENGIYLMFEDGLLKSYRR